jgi:predicted MPP superfamily phosphohydrolase
MDTDLMSNYVDVINDMKPDLIFIPGDMTNSKREEAAPFAKSFRELKAKYGVYATFGNHDYFNDVNYIADVINNETGIKLLRNEALLIDVNGKPLSIMGTEDTQDSGGKSNPVISKYITQTVEKSNSLLKEKNIDSAGVPKILLTHKPYVFDDVSDLNFDLMLSGHTHGGQVVFFKLGDINLSIAATVHKYINGLYNNENKYLYVSRGIGTVGLPLRFNCPPEITKITLL